MMPELPEVETVRRTLQPKLAGLTFTAVQILMPKVIKTPDPDKFREIILDKKSQNQQARQIPAYSLK